MTFPSRGSAKCEATWGLPSLRGAFRLGVFRRAKLPGYNFQLALLDPFGSPIGEFSGAPFPDSLRPRLAGIQQTHQDYEEKRRGEHDGSLLYQAHSPFAYL